MTTPNITQVTFYFAIQKQDSSGNLLANQPPESHMLTWDEVANNVGFSLSTGESMFTQLPTSDNHYIRVVNGFYFGEGAHGSLLGIQYHYEDSTEGWIYSIAYHSSNAQNLNMIIGNWIKDKTYEQIISDPNWLGIPYIGLENDYVDLFITQEESIEEPTDPVEEPTDPVEEPTDPVEEPTDPVEEEPENKEPPEKNFLIEVQKKSLLHHYPNIMKRNARYRGHRESEKFLNDHQEQIYDIRKLWTNLSYLENMKGNTIESWFHGETITSMFKIAEENSNKQEENYTQLGSMKTDDIRAFESDMIQLSGSSLEGRVTGIYSLKQRMQELDERIAEAERRYREYENAYK